MTYRQESNEIKQVYLNDLRQSILEIYSGNKKLTKKSIAEVVGMSNTEFSRFLHEPERGLSDERLTKLEAWVEENK